MKHLEIALKQYGTWEWKGEKHNPEVLKYFKEIGHSWVKDDETAWCSAFINWVCKKANLDFTGKLNARSWLNIGKKINKPEPGDIVVFWRESKSSWKGHVGLFINQTDDFIYVLGGNQSNQVNIKPYHKNRLLSYRRITN